LVVKIIGCRLSRRLFTAAKTTMQAIKRG